MEKIEIDNKEYLVELEWRPLEASGKSALKKAKETARALSKAEDGNDYKYAYIVESSGAAVAGYVENKSKDLPAAAYLAQANKEYNEKHVASSGANMDWVIVEPVDDRYWLCAIKDGAPLPGLDIMGTYEEISEAIDDLIELETFLFYTSSDDIFKNIKDIPGAGVEEKSFSEIIEDIKLKGGFKKVKGPNYVLIFSLLIIAIIAAVSYFLYASYKQAQLEEQQRLAAERARQQAQQRKETKLQAVENYKTVVREGFKNLNDKALSDSMSGSNKQILSYWANIIGNTPTNHNGWELSGIECDLDYCTVNLSRTDLTNNRLLKEMVDDITINGQSAFYRIEVPDADQTFISPDNVATDDDFLYNYISDFQNLSLSDSGIEYNIGQPEKVLYKIPKLDITNKEMPDLNAVQSNEQSNNRNSEPTVITLDNGWFKGNVNFNGSFIEFMYDLNRFIPDNAFSVKTINFSYPDLSWTLEASYMIKEKNPPTNPLSVYKQQLEEAGVEETEVRGGLPNINPNITSVGSQESNMDMGINITSEENNDNLNSSEVNDDFEGVLSQ